MGTKHRPYDPNQRPTPGEAAPYWPLAMIARHWAEAAADSDRRGDVYHREAAELLAAGRTRLGLSGLGNRRATQALAAIAARYEECCQADNPEALALEIGRAAYA